MLQGDSFVTKGAAANKTDAEEPAARKSSRLAQNSPITFKHLFSPPETPLQFGQENTPIETPGYQPFARHYDEARCKEEDESLNKLNAFLVSRNCSPVRSRYRMKGMLSQAAERTKREHLRKVKQGIVSVIETIAPGQEGETWAELTCSGSLDAFFNVGNLGRLRLEADHSIQALAAAYRQSDAKLTQIQILSIIIDIFPQQQIFSQLSQSTNYFKPKTFTFLWKRSTVTSCSKIPCWPNHAQNRPFHWVHFQPSLCSRCCSWYTYEDQYALCCTQHGCS